MAVLPFLVPEWMMADGEQRGEPVVHARVVCATGALVVAPAVPVEVVAVPLLAVLVPLLGPVELLFPLLPGDTADWFWPVPVLEALWEGCCSPWGGCCSPCFFEGSFSDPDMVESVDDRFGQH